MDFIVNNLGNIVAILIIVFAVTVTIIVLARRCKSGKTTCGCDCAFCNKDCAQKDNKHN